MGEYEKNEAASYFMYVLVLIRFLLKGLTGKLINDRASYLPHHHMHIPPPHLFCMDRNKPNISFTYLTVHNFILRHRGSQ